MSTSPGTVASVTELAVQDPRWDGYVTGSGIGKIYHHSGWLKALEAEYARAVVRLACTEADGRVVGILPLMYTRGLPFNRNGAVAGRRLSSLPRTPIAGPLATDERARALLVEDAIRRASARPGTRLELKVDTPCLDGVGLERRTWRNAYIVELPPSPQEIRFGDRRNHAAIARAVSKAKGAGVKIREGESEDDLRRWYRLYLMTMRANAVPARSYRFFAALWENLRPLGTLRLLLAEVGAGERPPLVAGILLLVFADTVSYAFGGSDRSAHQLRPNDALHWHAISDACGRGHRFYDLGEVDEANLGLMAYKRKWAQSPRTLHRYYLPAPPPSEAVGRGAVQSRALRRIWQQVPLSVTARAGDVFYRFL